MFAPRKEVAPMVIKAMLEERGDYQRLEEKFQRRLVIQTQVEREGLKRNRMVRKAEVVVIRRKAREAKREDVRLVP